MKADIIKKSKSFSSFSKPKRFGQLVKAVSNPKLLSKASSRDKIFTDSSSSDSSCFEKRYYKCGCLSHQEGCQVQYRDYLGELRQKRLRKASVHSNGLGLELQKLNLSQISEKSEMKMETPNKEEGVRGPITEMSESCEESNRKNSSSLTITLNGRQYLKVFKGKEDTIEGISFIEKLLSRVSA